MKKLIQLLYRPVFLLFTLNCFIYLVGYAQNKMNMSSEAQVKIDVLKQFIAAAPQDTNKIKLLLKLGKQYARSMPDTALFYYQLALNLSNIVNAQPYVAKSLNSIGTLYFHHDSNDKAIEYFLKYLKIKEEIGEKRGMAFCYNNIGTIYKRQAMYDKAIEYHLKSLKIAQELDDKKGISFCYNNIGIVYKDQGSFDKAFEYYLKSLKIKEELGDKKGMSKSYTNMGIIHHNQGSYDKALEYYLKALKIKEELQDRKGMSTCYINIGIVYANQSSYEEAIEYFHKALKIAEELGNERGMSLCYNNLGIINRERGSYDQAIEYYLKSLKIAEELGDRSGIAIKYANISSLNITLADSVALSHNQRLRYLNKAIEYGKKSMDIAKEIEAIPELNTAAFALMKAYKKLGNYNKSLEFAEIFISTQDSMFHEEKTKAIQEMGAKYETEKKEAQILVLENENLEKGLNLERRTNQRNIYFFSGSGGIVLILLLFVFYRHKAQKDKIITDQKIYQLEEEKKLLAAKSIVDGQEEERKRIAKELHDGLGVLLSTAKMQFTTFRDKSSQDKSLFYQVGRLLEQASEDVRKISHNMMPGLLTKFGLYEAVEDLIELVNETEEINAICEISGKVVRLPENTEIMIYRIIQELVNNSLKYAEATNISLKFNILPAEISFTYSDDGIGFNFEEKLKSKSIGLTSIQSRVNFLSGELEVESRPNEGVSFIIKVPL